MREYVVNFNSSVISQFLTNGQTLVKDNKGREEINGTYRNRPIAGTDTTVAVRKDFDNNKPLTSITQEELDQIVPYFGFVTKDKKDTISSARVDFGLCDFWNHEDLVLDIKNNGITLSVSNDPTESPKHFFWFRVMEKDPLFFIDDGKHRRPENMSEVMFIVKPKSSATKAIKKEYSSLTDASITLRAIIGATPLKKKFILDQIGENLYSDNTKEKELEDIILQSLDKHGDRRLDNGVKLGDFVESVLAENEDSFSISQSVNYAYKKGLINKAGDMFYYDNVACGGSYKEVEDYFKKSTNRKFLTALELNIKKLKDS